MRAQELAMQAGAAAQASANAAMLLGEVHWDSERPREAFAAFQTAQMVLTQQGLRTQQAAKVHVVSQIPSHFRKYLGFSHFSDSLAI